MKITLDFTKTVEENAAIYFEKSKKAKKKLEGALETVQRYQKKLKKEQREYQDLENESAVANENNHAKPVKRAWYEKFRWFVSSEGFLVIGGRDATTNEIVIKKHTDKEDFVFHTDMAGSPFFVIKVKEKLSKLEIKKPTDATFMEAAQATGAFSRAWKLGLTTLDVFYVKPDQVSKETEAGEYMAKGSFMIRGKREYVPFGKLEIAISFFEGRIISGPVSAIKKITTDYLVIIQGKDKTSDAAKKIKKKFGGTPDDIIRMLPAGGLKVIMQ